MAILASIVITPLLVIMIQSKSSEIKYSNQPLIKDFNKSAAEVSTIIIQNKDKRITLQRIGSDWTLKERQNYPAAESKVRELLEAIAEIKIIEPKTSNTLLFEQLDVADLTNSTSKAVQIILQDDQQHCLANLLVGKREAIQIEDKYVERLFVRKDLDQQVLLVQGILPLNLEVRNWVDQPLLDMVDSDQIKMVSITKPDAQVVTIEKASVEEQDFKLDNPPEIKAGMKLDADAVNTVPFEMGELEVEDIVPADQEELDWSQSINAKVETFSGMALDLKVINKEGRILAKIVAQTNDAATDEVKQQAVSFNNNTQNWFYNLSPEFFKTINLAAADFLQVDEALNEPVVN